jgi:hypothetical protein
MALLTAGEKGEPMAILPGDCAVALPVRGCDVEPGVIRGLLPTLLLRSGFSGICTWRSTGCRGDPGELVVDGHGGAGACCGGCKVRGEGSALGASGISSILESIGVGIVTLTSSISTSAVGGGVVSFAGVGSRGVMSTDGAVDVSIIECSSCGGDGGSGDGLLEDTSLSVGDLVSTLTDIERRRSRWSLSSWACCSSLRLNDSGGFISLIRMQV